MAPRARYPAVATCSHVCESTAYLYVHLGVRARLPPHTPHPRHEAYQAQLCPSLEPWSSRNHQRSSCPDRSSKCADVAREERCWAPTTAGPLVDTLPHRQRIRLPAGVRSSALDSQGVATSPSHRAGQEQTRPGSHTWPFASPQLYHCPTHFSWNGWPRIHQVAPVAQTEDPLLCTHRDWSQGLPQQGCRSFHTTGSDEKGKASLEPPPRCPGCHACHSWLLSRMASQPATRSILQKPSPNPSRPDTHKPGP